MSVTVEWLDEGSAWLAEVVSSENDQERILIGTNGRIALKTNGDVFELWPGFAEEPEPVFEDEEDGDE